LFLLSESRGKDASGLALLRSSNIFVLKRPMRAKWLIQSSEYATRFENLQSGKGMNISKGPIVAMGHTRMVTNGPAETHENNQPILKGGMVCLHNGIVVNDRSLWDHFRELRREFDVDTEIILALISLFRSRDMKLYESIVKTFQYLQGANSVALLDIHVNAMILASTNGSIYFSRGTSGNEMLFASEKYILEKLRQGKIVRKCFGDSSILQVKPGTGHSFTLDELRHVSFRLGDGNQFAEDLPDMNPPRMIFDLKPNQQSPKKGTSIEILKKDYTANEKLLLLDHEAIANLRRCTHCLLPETFPFIAYDEKGVCNYCRRYKPLEFEGEEGLKERVKKHRTSSAKPNCIVALSGGRDSSYGLHYVKNELGLNPLAYTYDWGMITDIARRNISRMCGALGVEHILISANIQRKRSFIRKNVLAWLKKPDLGTIPLFMAGDKQYFYHANRLMQQYAIDLFIMSENRLERTHFKHGFCGVKHSDFHMPPYFLNGLDKVKLAAYYAKQYIRNPAFINQSLLDTFGAYLSYYVIPHHYLYLYNYIPWVEEEIEKTLIGHYDWERSPDTKSTWRIGDGTSAFYNYIYLRVAGFTENDTFRSNQIREGFITREKALEIVNEDNRPRFASIRWYCDTIAIDVVDTLRIIHKIPTLY
jgi:hypothetical protein